MHIMWFVLSVGDAFFGRTVIRHVTFALFHCCIYVYDEYFRISVVWRYSLLWSIEQRQLLLMDVRMTVRSVTLPTAWRQGHSHFFFRLFVHSCKLAVVLQNKKKALIVLLLNACVLCVLHHVLLSDFKWRWIQQRKIATWQIVMYLYYINCVSVHSDGQWWRQQQQRFAPLNASRQIEHPFSCWRWWQIRHCSFFSLFTAERQGIYALFEW